MMGELEVRGPSDRELRATTLLEFFVNEASSKVRSGPPMDNQSDYGLRVWAGVLPLEIKSRSPITDDQLVGGVVIPDYVLRYDARLGGGASHSAENRRKRSGNES
jgi:hypothetical protein